MCGECGVLSPVHHPAVRVLHLLHVVAGIQTRAAGIVRGAKEPALVLWRKKGEEGKDHDHSGRRLFSHCWDHSEGWYCLPVCPLSEACTYT